MGNIPPGPEFPPTKSEKRERIRDKKSKHKIHGKGLAEWYRRVIEKTREGMDRSKLWPPQHPLGVGV